MLRFDSITRFGAMALVMASFIFAENRADIQGTLDSICIANGFPGATCAFALQDGSVRTFASGLSDVEGNIPMTPESRMLAASIGKTFTGATALAVCREKGIELDDPISTWLSDRSWFDRLPNHEDITLKHLLTHTSGLPDHVKMEVFQNDLKLLMMDMQSPFQPESLLAYILDKDPLFEAGSDWHYTDTGYILLGLIIEEISGMDYYSLADSLFIRPLELTMTEPSDRRKLEGLAVGYIAEDNPFGLPHRTLDKEGVMLWHPGIEWTGGGFVSSSSDLARWGKALFEGKAMDGDYVGDLLDGYSLEGENIAYGLGVGIYRGGDFGDTYGHGGWIPGYCSSLRYYPDHGIAVAFQVNTDIGITDSEEPVLENIEKALITSILKETKEQK